MKNISLIMGLAVCMFTLSACSHPHWHHPAGAGHHNLHAMHHHDYKGERG